MMDNVQITSEEWSDHMTIEEWEQSVDCGLFIDYDGFGHFADKLDGIEWEGLDVYPSMYKRQDPRYLNEKRNWTHIVWFNR